MEGAERERERLAEARPATSPTSSPPPSAAPHVVLDVLDELVPTPAAHTSSLPPPPTSAHKDSSTDPASATGSDAPEVKDSAPASAPGSDAPDVKDSTPTSSSVSDAPDGKVSAPTPISGSDGKGSPARPPPPPPSPTSKRDDSNTAPSNGKGSPPRPPPPTTPTSKLPDDSNTAATTTAPNSDSKEDGLNTSPRPLFPSSEISSTSAANIVPHTSSTNSELFEDEDSEFKRRDMELTNREEALKEALKLAKKLRNDNEIKRRNQEIELKLWGEQMDILEDELATKEQELRVAKLRDREKRLKYRKDELIMPLLEQEDHNKKNKDADVRDKRQNIMAISLACGLSVLISMQPLFPPYYLKWIVGSFALMWALATIALPAGLFVTHRLEKDFSRHISRLTFTSFAMFVLYILYLLSQPSAPQSSDITPSPSPQQLELWVPSLDYNATFYILLGVLTLIAHIALWISGCVTGGDKDP